MWLCQRRNISRRIAACSMYSQRRGGYTRGVRQSPLSADAAAVLAANNCAMADHHLGKVARRSGMTTIGVAQAGFGGLKRPQKGRRTSADIVSPLCSPTGYRRPVG